jgi:hypothetical protein
MLLLQRGPLDATMRARLQEPARLAVVSGLALGLSGVVLFGFWSWHRLQPIRFEPDGSRVYDVGILVVGGSVGMLLPLISVVEQAPSVSLGLLLSRPFWAHLLLGWFVGLPLGLWGGAAWSQLMGGAELRRRR